MDKPYTTPDEDPFSARPVLQPRRRRSSLLEKWIQEQQKLPVSTETPGGCSSLCPPRSNPYLAYPDLGMTQEGHSTVTLDSFELVDESDIPQDIVSENPVPPSTPSHTPHKSFLGTPTSFRSLHMTFRSQSPARSVSPSGAASISPSRKMFLPLGSRSASKQHNRSSSLSMFNSSSPHSAVPESPLTHSKWRPSVLGYFSPSTTSQLSFIPSETIYTPSRPSDVSSNTTVTTTTTTTATTVTSVTATAIDDTKPSLVSGIASVRSRQRSYRNLLRAASDNSAENDVPISPLKHTTLRLPLAPKTGVRLANSNVNPEESDDENCSTQTPMHTPKPITKPEVVFKSNAASKISFSTLTSKNSKKKRLVISGIASNDVRKFEGIKHWCEGFGEVTHIIRMPNGDLHVHFRSADVADTVCRLRAKVYIVGCGSVGVSWTAGSKR